MKTWKQWTFAAIIAFFGIMVCFSACSDGGGGDGRNQFKGTWTGTDSDGDEMVIIFGNGNWTLSFTGLLGSDNGTYTYSGKNATLKDSDGDKYATASISGTTLKFIRSNGELHAVLTKSGNNNVNSGDTSASFTMTGWWYGYGENYYVFDFGNMSNFDVKVTIDGKATTLPMLSGLIEEVTLTTSSSNSTKTVTYSPSNKVRFEKVARYGYNGDIIHFHNK